MTRSDDTVAAGLEIGSGQIKAVILRDGSPLSVVREPLPAGAVTRGQVTDKAALVDALKTLVRREGLPRRLHVTIAADGILGRTTSLPNAGDEALLRATIATNAPELLDPIDPDAATLDYVELSRNGAQSELAITAIDNSLLYGHLEALRSAGIEVASIESTASAAARLIAHQGDETKVFLQIGAEITVLAILDRGAVRFHWSFETGGRDFTNAVEALDFVETHAQAERLKREHGVGSLDEEPSGDPETDSVQSTLFTVADGLVQDITSALNHYRELPEGSDVQRVIICGGSARMPGLKTMLAEYLNCVSEDIQLMDTGLMMANLDLYISPLGACYGMPMNHFPPKPSRRGGARAKTALGAPTTLSGGSGLDKVGVIAVAVSLAVAGLLFAGNSYLERRAGDVTLAAAATRAQAQATERSVGRAKLEAPAAFLDRNTRATEMIQSRRALGALVANATTLLPRNTGVAVDHINASMQAGRGRVMITGAGAKPAVDTFVAELTQRVGPASAVLKGKRFAITVTAAAS